MRQSVAALALIRQFREGGRLWLARWNYKWKCFNFVGGHRHADEAYRDCLLRELHEELGWAERQDFEVPEWPAAHVEYVGWSRRVNKQTHYVLELFELRPCRNHAWRQVAFVAENRWLTEGEIRRMRTTDGKPVSETMAFLLTKIGWQRENNESRFFARDEIIGRLPRIMKG